MTTNFTVTVFCGSTLGNKAIYKEKTIQLASRIAERGISLVYGGGNRGLMGVLAHSVRENGGYVTGVLPKAMNIPSVTNGSSANETIITENMHERKQTMYDKADGFIALPGGIGTFEELCEIYTWRQLGYTKANIALFNVDGYFDSFLSLLDNAVKEGFVNEAVRNVLIVSDDPDVLLDHLKLDHRELPSKL